ncbi:MAG: hypothetical protein JWQ89_2434 [Devosia sp.]|uniref:citrate synthase/methylcitrate synthase n=1 Tax=Devosia sp. TaxID=1871048 RepID=UPI002607A9A0|nr:citrate synthase/methylcitrate synthase [Devosia sp.]MDB5540707.1 hypothetical protein [Devosia sp.]
MNDGLEDVIAAETVLSDVDGLAGRLIIRGQPLEALAGSRFEDVLALLWDGFFPDLPGDLRGPLAEARATVFKSVRAQLPLLADRPAYDAMRALIATLPDRSDLETALLLAVGPAVILPALIRQQRGLAPIAPDPSLGHCEDMLQMLTGARPAPAAASALDTYLLAVAEHGLNASTFAARVVASTLAGLNSSVLAALGALKGPLHGGALGPVLDMLDAIGNADNATAWIEGELASGRRLMGFGHRIYRVRDPRADALKTALRRLSESGTIDMSRIGYATAIETAALAALQRHKPDRILVTNVDFFSVLLLEALDFPRDTFTAVFSAGRVGGWIAHAREQLANGRLIRPKSRYVGPVPQVAA